MNLKIHDERAREVLLKDPESLRIRRASDGQHLFQVVEGNMILAEGRYKTKALMDVAIVEFETGEKVVKKPDVDVSVVQYNSKDSLIESGGPTGAADLIERLPMMNSRDLMKIVEGAVTAERITFVMRGAAAFELVKRKLREVGKFSTADGAIGACNTLAKEIGIDGKTIYKDYKIFEEFGARLVTDLKNAPERILPREMYALAVNANKELAAPADVLDYFEEQRESTGGYFTDHARRDIKRVNEGVSLDDIRVQDGLERIEKINEVKERTLTIQIPATKENNWFLGRITEDHASFANWFKIRCLEEFGTK